MPLFRHQPTGKPGEWYFCLKHQTVEEGPECAAKDRLGPYGSRAEAERALQTAAERNREWRTDPNWNDDDPSQDQS
ncbi:hypothetical protein C7C46_17870 [Streptomyces tateyamensis]|uniref:SPOR domain-containing protein n=1 Tax=Streptomyces tateyamensis TaxID=565073 RepID=A0A2V4NCJ6_9ACTN|nr:hypothetical protein [Streptomyces tateyamensis]PYC77838.1 hypothetical protein C7C46_17870 [Streptomyces tateyamensis]